MKVTKNPTSDVYNFENGEFVEIYHKQGVWEYTDSLKKDEWNMGTYAYDADKKVCYIMTSSCALQSAIIHALKDKFGAVEWVEPKVKKRRAR